MYYINSFFLYAFLGFVIESTIFKNSFLKPSGVLCGPITLVYGIGGIVLLLTNKYIVSRIRGNKVVKIVLSFLIYVLVLSLTEFISGYLCRLIFGVDMWNYSSKKYNLGKYVCLEYTFIWGFYGVIVTYVFKSFFDKIVNLISREATYFFLLILFFDIVITIMTK